jgi:hypothetical protein
MSMKNSNDTIGNQTRDLLACSAVPQPTAPPCAVPVWDSRHRKFDFVWTVVFGMKAHKAHSLSYCCSSHSRCITAIFQYPYWYLVRWGLCPVAWKSAFLSSESEDRQLLLTEKTGKKEVSLCTPKSGNLPCSIVEPKGVLRWILSCAVSLLLTRCSINRNFNYIFPSMFWLSKCSAHLIVPVMGEHYDLVSSQ